MEFTLLLLFSLVIPFHPGLDAALIRPVWNTIYWLLLEELPDGSLKKLAKAIEIAL